MAKFWLGVDGGGTKTSVVCVDQSGEVLFQANAGSTNSNSVGVEEACKQLHIGIKKVLKYIEESGPDASVGGVVLGMSGVDRPADVERVRAWAHSVLPTLPAAALSVYNDAVVALASGTHGRLHGCVLISGTGTIALSFDSHGEQHRVQGWGPLFSDEGSGYAIGSAVLQAVARAQDKLAPETQLTAALLAHLHLQSASELLPWAYGGESGHWDRFAALAPLAHQCCRSHDSVAARIIENAACSLAEAAICSANKAGLTPEDTFAFVLVGGNLAHEDSALRELVSKRLRDRFPLATPLVPTQSPAVGAALLARSLYAVPTGV